MINEMISFQNILKMTPAFTNPQTSHLWVANLTHHQPIHLYTFFMKITKGYIFQIALCTSKIFIFIPFSQLDLGKRVPPKFVIKMNTERQI